MIQETSGPAQATETVSKPLADDRWFMSFMSCSASTEKKTLIELHFIFCFLVCYYLILSYHVISSLISKSQGSWMLLAQSLKLWGLWDTINAWVIKKSGIFIACRHSQLSERNGHGNTIRGSIMKDQSPIQPNWNIHWNFSRACAWYICLAFGKVIEGRPRDQCDAIENCESRCWGFDERKARCAAMKGQTAMNSG